MAHSLPGKPSVLDFNPPNDSPEHEWDTGKIPAPATGGLEFATQNVPFRILVAGKTGVGKSTLVAAVFGVPPAKVSFDTIAQ
jgi:predicted GTPase